MKQRLNRIAPLLGTAALLSSSLHAQSSDSSESSTPPVTGVFSLDVNTHFISYGADVWGAGTTGTSWNNPTFNPSAELTIAGPKGVNFIVGTWWDVNDNSAAKLPGTIGDRKIQEIDVWVGASYTYEKITGKILYQEWMYGGDSERIVDFVLSASMTLNPSLTIHTRPDGNGAQVRGVVAVAGISHSVPAGPVTFSFPLNVAFCSGGYFGGSGGYAFTSLGANASYPLKFMPGNWTLNAGVTGYHTPNDVYPTNPDELFLTGKLGLTLAF